MSDQPMNPNQIASGGLFAMASAVVQAACGMLVTTAVRGNQLVDKTASTLIHGVSAAENISIAVEQRSKIYGDGIVRNGELSERETTLRYRLRLANLEKQEKDILAGLAAYTPDPSLKDKLKKALEQASSALGVEELAHNRPKTAQTEPAIRSASERARKEAGITA
jgi:hypothetical protein